MVGFGRSGQAVARYLSRHGARVLISDTRGRSQLNASEEKLIHECSAEYEGGGHTERFLRRAEKIIVSPGVSLEHPTIVQLMDSGVPVLGELALAADHFRAPVIAITGTNGKTTVTEMIGALLVAAGKKVFVGGNIGTPIGEYLLSPGGYDAVVLEVSSFQLDLSGGFTPKVAVLLNITPDHLDRHGSLARYAAAKMKIFDGGQAIELAVMNGDDPLSRRYLYLSGRDSFQRFGHGVEYTACAEGNRITISEEKGAVVYDLSGSDLATLSGCLNSAAALLAVQPFGVRQEIALQTLRSFKTGAHRVQVVAEVEGVTYIDDSKATNTGAVNNAIEQIGSGVILIAGGKDKGDDYRLLRESVSHHVKRLVLIGEAARSIAEALGDLVPVKLAGDMDGAVRYAASRAIPGDTVLLSPACASFDMYRSYKHRGDCFIEAVETLKGGKLLQVLS